MDIEIKFHKIVMMHKKYLDDKITHSSILAYARQMINIYFMYLNFTINKYFQIYNL